MSPVRSVTYVSGPDLRIYGAGDGNRTHVRSLGSFYTAIVRRPLIPTARLYLIPPPREKLRAGSRSPRRHRLAFSDFLRSPPVFPVSNIPPFFVGLRQIFFPPFL